MNHRLKIEVPLFERVANGSRTFHVDSSDHGFQQGDTVTLCEFDETPINATSIKSKGFTKRELDFRIGFVDAGSSRVIFSLLPVDPPHVFRTPNEIAHDLLKAKAKTRRKG